MHLLSWFFTKCHYVKTDDINAEYVDSSINTIGYAPRFENPTAISYADLMREGTTKDCYLTISACLVIGKHGPIASLWVSQDGVNWYDIGKCRATDYYDNVNGYVSLPFMGFVKKGTRFKYRHSSGYDIVSGINYFIAYEFSS